MYDLAEAIQIHKEELSRNPEFNNELVAEWIETTPDEFTCKMLKRRYGNHIVDEKMYNKAVSLLKWPDERTYGPKWSVADIRSSAGIDFNSKKYTILDFAYIMNMLWSDYSNIFTDTNYYFKMAKNYLEDADYMGDPSERAFENAIQRIRYFKEK